MHSMHKNTVVISVVSTVDLMPAPAGLLVHSRYREAQSMDIMYSSQKDTMYPSRSHPSLRDTPGNGVAHDQEGSGIAEHFTPVTMLRHQRKLTQALALAPPNHPTACLAV